MKTHAFFATRKGTPKGVAGDWAKHCDVCGGDMSEPQHRVSQAVADQSVLDAIEGKDDSGVNAILPRVER